MNIDSSISKIEKRYGLSKREDCQTDLSYIKDLVDIDNNDKKDDAQRRMTWIALLGMLMYPFLVLLGDYFGIPHASDLISGMSAVYFASVSAIIMVFFGANAYIRTRKKNKETKETKEKENKNVENS